MLIDMKAFWTISLLFVLLPWTVAVDREEYTQKVVNDCCNLGKNSTDETCTEYEPMSYFDAAWNNFCSVHYTKCCEEVRAKHNCEKGKQAAFDAVECSDLPLNENGAFIFSLFQSYCCHACRSGINVAKESNNTEQCTLKFSPRLDETAFSACCKITIQKMRGATTTTTVAPDDAPYRCPQCQHKCIPNLAGIITCECFPGFKLAPDGISCLDIDECALNASICGPGSVCVNKQGSHECVDQAPSPSETRMETVAAPDLMFGQLREECDDGYQFDEGEKICMDIDECLDNLHNCKENEKCTNTDGSFQCQVESCPNGERLDENNECVPGNECERGFQYDDLFDECRDIDECDRNSTLCPKDEFCNNLEGSYECKKLECLKGFKPKTSFFMTTCEDINECREDPHVCDNRLESCVNLPGSYECICNSGYEKQGSTDECVDINECKSNPSPCPQYSYCTNTPGSYKCQCHDGFKESENHFDDLSSCSDIDECQDGSAECPEGAICLNRPGHYECKCPSGQEVLINSNKCVTKSPCKALKVNDTCLCPPNFKLSHENDCVDINECDDPNETKCTPDEICLNLFGGYKCLSTACPPGYIRNENYKPNK